MKIKKKQIKALGNIIKRTFVDTDKNSIVSLSSKDFLNEEATYEMNKIAEMENKLKRDDLINNTSNRKKDKRYDFQKFEAKRKKNLYDALEQQVKLKDDINNFKESTKAKESVKKNKKKHTNSPKCNYTS